MDRASAMHTLYDSDTFIVTHLLAPVDAAPPAAGEGETAPALVRHGFEIVDKRAGKEVYLDGSWAELFQQRLADWQRSTPTQEEVEDTLAQYAELAYIPLYVH
jgi:hypothetical protein